jgi:hypothetical protein
VAAARGTRLHWAALAFAVAALLSSWNPLAAPFGLVVGISAMLIAIRASVAGGRRPVWVTALSVALIAAVGSAVVLARTAGVGRKAEAGEIVSTPSAAEVGAELDAAAARTRPARERATKELNGVAPSPGSAQPSGAKPRNR